MSFTVVDLPYPKESLEPFISRETFEFHYEKHHKAYATKLNQLVAGKPEEKKTLVEIIVSTTGPIYNNAAQVWNHNFYWLGLTPTKTAPEGKLLDLINAAFGSFEDFKKKFTDRGVGHFASGWVWLVLNKEGKLDIWDGHDAGNPLTAGLKPLLTLDVWEHAYYIDRRNRRQEYIDNWFNVVNWDFVRKNLDAQTAAAITTRD